MHDYAVVFSLIVLFATAAYLLLRLEQLDGRVEYWERIFKEFLRREKL